jgi:glycosidase family protein
MKKTLLFLSIIALSLVISCKKSAQVHPDWSYSAVIYEMNMRQYTPEGTFAAAQAELPRLKELGVDVLWLMPIYPIGVKERKGTLGSYYAISDYCAVNPEFGSMKDFEDFLSAAHKAGFKVILDWVANHTSPDARWIDECPADWYERDSLGNTIVEYDWTDIAALNYDNRDVWTAQDKAMRFWLDKGVDGFRCDMACEVPVEFWRETISGLRADYPGIYMLAEGEEPGLHQDAFDASYAWVLHHLLNDIAQGKKGAKELAEYVAADAQKNPAEAFRLMFTSNHDENSWAGTEFERMGDAAKAMAVLTFTLPNGQPLIYTGQEIGWNKRFEFFEKDPIPAWKENEYTDFYKWLINLRHDNPALAAGEKGGKFELISIEDGMFVFSRTLPGNRVTVSVRLSAPWDYSIESDKH